ncbi:MAG: response regulator [Alphaproteobacteria bacterium]
MIVVVKKAEEALFQDLKKIWETNPTYRCLYLRFSRLEQNKEEWFPVLMKMLPSSMIEEIAQVYVCHDNDVFVVSRSMTQKSFQHFFSHLSPKLMPAPAPGLADLFEIGVDWPRLRTICEKKIENRKILEEEGKRKNSKEKEVLNHGEALSELNSQLIASLPRRRTERDKMEIMIVEDDMFSQRLVTNSLKAKYNISLSEDGRGAIMTYLTKAPDVLFLDIGLPDMDGHAVLERIFKIDPNAYVVMFSGNGNRENILKAIELGAKGFVGKPFTQDKLFYYIEKSPFIQAKQKKEQTNGHSQH